MQRTLTKVLSANDVGLTGSHQAGIVVPRQPEALAFFPELNGRLYNPREVLAVRDCATGKHVDLNYIYYNGKLHGRSTRNEYRLTGLTRFLSEKDARPGDRLEFSWSETEGYLVDFVSGSDAVVPVSDGDEVIVLSGTWFTSRRNR